MQNGRVIGDDASSASANEEKKDNTADELPEPKAQWVPSPSTVASSNITRFIQHLKSSSTVPGASSLENYSDLQRWTLNNLDEFWSQFFDFSGIVALTKGDRIRTTDDGSDVPFHRRRFFPDARLNYAENLLRFSRSADGGEEDDGEEAVVFWGEDRIRRRLTHVHLYGSVARLADYFRRECNLRPGDRVAGFVPNAPESLVAMLAAASIGCVWSSCSPDFGVPAVLDRFGQIEPKVLIAADEYYYNGKTFDCLKEKVPAIVEGLPTLEKVVVFNYAGSSSSSSAQERIASLGDGAVSWEQIMEAGGGVIPPLQFEQLPFDHPLFILFSSGTTGVPKCIVHSAGGTLLQHMKEHQLHCDVRPNDANGGGSTDANDHRVFYFTTCGWMMWNWQVSALASGATLLLYDGSPFYGPTKSILWDYAQQERCTLFGTSAKYLDAMRKFGLHPNRTHDLGSVRTITSTGSPLVPEGFDYVYDSIKGDVNLASISGGTDIVSCFVLGCPTLPVYRGEIQTAGLGMDVDVYDDSGRSVSGTKGELICKSPFPSMPVGFWGDDDHDTKFKAAYFERFPGVWCHGDYAERTPRGGYVIYGRSDTVLNPCGVRIGTAEIYRQVEKVDEVLESLAVGQDMGGGDERIVLFVRIRPGLSLDDELRDRIRKVVRKNATPRHVPAVILEVPDIPRTKSGKIVEMAVRDVVHGRPVKNDGALANPEALAHFSGREELAPVATA